MQPYPSPYYFNSPQYPIYQRENVTWIPVAGMQGAKDYVMQPNSTAWLMDSNESVFYCKSTDNIGTPTIKAYRFEEITNDKTGYVSKKEFDELKDKVIKLTERKKNESNTRRQPRNYDEQN